ncbi:33592_t:CDS:2, partial [Gigaspora margarita]
ANLVKAMSIKKILKQANILIAFFQKSRLASRLLCNTISSINIKDKSLETCSKTFWVSIYDTTNSIIHVKPEIDNVYKLITNLADCFIGIVQIAVALKKIPGSNNFCTLAIGLKNRKFLEIGKIVVDYYKEALPNDKEYSVEDENSDLQELAKTIFAIVPLQANSFQNSVDLLDPIFGVDNNQVEPILTEEETEETNIEFESRALVWDIE